MFACSQNSLGRYMRRFILGQSGDFYSPHSGLALVGLCMNRYTNLAKMVGREESLSRTYHKNRWLCPQRRLSGTGGLAFGDRASPRRPGPLPRVGWPSPAKVSGWPCFIGQLGLLGEAAPIRHSAKRRRIKTVIQELIYLAGRLISSGRRWKLRFGRHCPGFRAFALVYNRLALA